VIAEKAKRGLNAEGAEVGAQRTLKRGRAEGGVTLRCAQGEKRPYGSFWGSFAEE
jgi:hypothetical protein